MFLIIFLWLLKLKICFYGRGKDDESHEMLTQGFTHAIIMTFTSKEEYKTFASHPNHVEFSSTFATVIDKAVLLDFPPIYVKPPAWHDQCHKKK